MITNSGIWMRPGEAAAPTPRDIAVGMCRITRYAGAIWVPLAAHSILVAEFAYRATQYPCDFAFGLLHDAHETVTGEVTRKWKPPEMKSREADLDARIFAAFNLSISTYAERHDLIKAADEKALCAEATLCGLPHWAEYYEREEGRAAPALTADENAIATAIIDRWTNPHMACEDSLEIKILTRALIQLAAGMTSAAWTTLWDAARPLLPPGSEGILDFSKA